MWKKIRSLITKEPRAVDFYRDTESGLYAEQHFRMSLHLEEMRSERSGVPFLLMLLSMDELGDHLVREAAKAVLSCTREVDLKGWWHTGREIGILFTEINGRHRGDFIIAEKILTDKIKKGLLRKLGFTAAERIRFSCTLLPEGRSERQNDEGSRESPA